MPKIEYKIFEAEVKAFDDENLTVEHFISTEHKDRGGDIMRAKGMKVVGKPVVLLLHGRGPMGSEPVGKPLSIDVDEFKGQPGILAKTQFYNDEVGQRLYGKVKGGFLPNWSIGYAVDEAKDLLRDGRYDGRDVTKWQLLEYSPVGVPMNPFAQTIKEFLDRADAGELAPVKLTEAVKEGTGWFGFADPKGCNGCGQECHDQGEKKPDDKEAPKDEEKPYPNEHACRVMDPAKCKRFRRQNDKFAEGVHAIWGVMEDDTVKLQAIRFDSSKFTEEAAKKWAKDHDYACTPFEPATGKEEQIPEAEPELLAKIAEQEALADPDGGAMMQIRTLRGLVEALTEKFKGLPESVEVLKHGFAKLEPLLKTLPPEPDGGEKGDKEHPDNPPEPGKVKPPRLVIVRDEEKPEEKQKAQILAAMREAYSEVVKQEIDRMKGRVP